MDLRTRRKVLSSIIALEARISRRRYQDLGVREHYKENEGKKQKRIERRKRK